MLSMLSINRGNRLDSVERVEAGEKIDSSERQQILRLSVSRRKESGDVAQLVRALPCHGPAFRPVENSAISICRPLERSSGAKWRFDLTWWERCSNLASSLNSARTAAAMAQLAGGRVLPGSHSMENCTI